MSQPIPSSPTSHEPSLGALVASATKDLSALVRSEIELAKHEVKDEVKHGVLGSAMFIVAGFFAFLALILLLIAAAYGLASLGLAPGWAFLIVAGVLLLVAGAVVFIGIRQLKKISVPEATIRTTKDSVATLKGSALH
ncbi:phage holin family protein [Motilibacter peucedani]|uniref:phage holin family protein n=1 Tax=Motilibacter peucedani TaxID=598650 RepID=UPI001E2FCF0C|nr:phage holin family protein [Motilibacter peucedani]